MVFIITEYFPAYEIPPFVKSGGGFFGLKRGAYYDDLNKREIRPACDD